MQFIYLIILGVLAGIVAAVASMASLVSYPGPLLFGLSPVSANMTNTAALVTTGFGSLSLLLKGDAGALGGALALCLLPIDRGLNWGAGF